MNCCACSKIASGVDQDLADVGLEIVADRADHEARFLVDQERRRIDGLAALILLQGRCAVDRRHSCIR